MASLPVLEAQRSQLLDEIASAKTAQLNATKAKFSARQKLDFGGDQLSAQTKTQLEAQISQANAEIATQSQRLTTLNAQLVEVNAQITQAQAAGTLPSQSTGQTVVNSQTAREDGASPTNPPPGPQTDANGRIIPTETKTDTNAEKFDPVANTDVGTNQPTVPLNATQKIPAPTAEPGGPVPGNYQGDADAQPGGFYGGGSAPDDNTPGDNGVKAELNRVFGSAQKLKPTSNPLDKYASYTYNVSIYIMSPVQYKQMLVTNNRSVPGWQLLMQSGGAPASSGVTTNAQDLQYENFDAAVAAQQQLAAEGRNQFFPLDYYIDDITLKSLVQGRGTRAAHGVFELTFKIYEPNGFTLFDRLYLATQQYTDANPGGPKNYLAQNYLMVIKFYGYDDAGNLVRPNQGQKTGANSDANAVIEKWYPFQFTQIRTKIHNKVTEYDCSAACPATTINGGQARGTIPYNVELTATTVKDLLFGNAKFNGTTGAAADSSRTDTNSNAGDLATGARNNNIQNQFRYNDALGNNTGLPGSLFDLELGGTGAGDGISTALGQTSTAAPAKANAAPTTLLSGLVDALNKYQADLCKVKKPGEAPVYTYPDVYDIVIKDDVLKNAKVISPGEPNKASKPMTKAQTAAQAKLGSKQSVDNNSENKSILAGTSIVQFIEQILRTSTYITDQQLYTISTTGDIQPNGKPAQTVGWFHIGMQAEPLQYDYRRNDYAYKITYSVSLYAITESKSDWFPDSVYRGTQKQYNYWFTGQNTQVLDFTQELNALYYMVMSGPSPERTYYTDYREFDKRSWQPRSDESDQGNRNKTFEPAANLADSIYSPADTFRARMVIIGDPDWMQQGEPVFGINTGKDRYGAFLSDGSINFESQEPLFEILYNKPVDYDLWTGLMDPGQNNFYANRPEGKSGEARVSQIYRCFMVYSHLNRGKFTQEIEGAQVRFQSKFPKKNDTTRSSTAAAKNSANATNSRLPGSLFDLELGGTGDGDAIMALSGTARNAQTPITSTEQITYDEFGNPVNTTTTTVAPASPAQPPTSSGQTVGSASTSNSGTGGASGTNVGQPVTVTAYLNNNQAVQVTNQDQIDSLRRNGQLSVQAASATSRRLNIAQQAASTPTTSAKSQVMARENG